MPRVREDNMIYECLDVVPSSCWTEDANSHILLIDLPGFKKEKVKVRADNHSGLVIVSGERQIISGNKMIHFEHSFNVPANSITKNTTANFEDQILYITIPKRVRHDKKIPDVENSTSVVHEQDHYNVVADNFNNNNNVNDKKYYQVNEGTSPKDEEVKECDGAKLGDEWPLLDSISKNLSKNRTVILAAVLGFSLGVLVSHRYHANAQVERCE